MLKAALEVECGLPHSQDGPYSRLSKVILEAVTVELNINSKRFVSFDDTHQRRVDTSLDANPSRGRVDDVRFHFIFRRNRTGDLDRDGNPLIYALKGMNGYRIVPMYRQMFLRWAEVLAGKIAPGLEVDFVMSVPSSYPFCEEFAKALSRWLAKEHLQPDFLAKKTVGEVLDGPLMSP
jgi:hypothetical protein